MTRVFHSINTFVDDISLCFEDERPITLYRHLLSRTKPEHTMAINKHITIFRKWCTFNRQAIETNDVGELKDPKIKYSDKVFIDVKKILIKSDHQQASTIWRHLMVLSAYLDKESHTKELLASQEISASQSAPKDCTGFITDMVDTISSKIELPKEGEPVNVAEVMNKIVSSGAIAEVFNSVQNGLRNGDIDLNGLMCSVKGMMANGDAPDIGEMLSNIQHPSHEE
jgi:hypothetical protein